MVYVKVIGVDAIPLIRVKGGVGFYVRVLLEHLIILSPNSKFILFTSRLSDDIDYFSKYPNVTIAANSFFSVSEAIWSQTTLAYLAWQHGIDVFWGTTQSVPIFKSSRMRNVLTIHDFTYLLFPSTMSFGRRWYLRLFSRAIIHRADIIVANSFGTAARLQSFYGRKADNIVEPPIRNFPEVTKSDIFEMLHKYNCKHKEFCLCVASFEPRKNLISLLSNYIELIDEGLDLLPLVIIGGNGWNNARLVNLIHFYRSKFNSKIVFLNFTDDRVLSAFIRSAKLLIMPSLYEGYGMPIAEARNVGTPIVATDIPEHREAAENDGIFFSPADIKMTIAEYLTSSSVQSSTNPSSYRSNECLASIMLDMLTRLTD